MQVDQYFRFGPQIFQPVIIALLFGKQVHHHIAKVNYYPARFRATFNPAVDLVILFRGFRGSVSQGVQHTVTGAIANYKIICKG